MIFIRLVKIDFYMNHLVSHLLPLFCYQEEKEKKKKGKKKSGQHSQATLVSV